MLVAANILRNPKSRYRDNGLTNRHEIWHGDAIRLLWYFPKLEICNFKNPTWRPPPFWKIAISRPKFQQNLARWHSSALVTVWSVTNLTSNEIQDGGSRHPKNLKIMITVWPICTAFWHDDVYWPSEPGVLFTKVRTPVSMRKFCVRKFLCA